MDHALVAGRVIKVGSIDIAVGDVEPGRPQLAYASTADGDMREALGFAELSTLDVGDGDDAELVHHDDVAAEGLTVEADDFAGDDDEVVQAATPAPASRAVAKPVSYKPGTRVIESKRRTVLTGERSWWESNDPNVWADKQTELKLRTSPDTRNILCWSETGLSGGRG